MKIFLFASLLTFGCLSSFSQMVQRQIPNAIPAFRMQLTNGEQFSSADIPKNKPTVLVYFAPDCDHCIVLIDKLFKKIHQLDKASIIMITFKPLNELAAFERKYKTARFPNMKVGTEGYNYVVRDFYNLQKTPFTAVYDKKGKLAFFYREDTPVDEMLARFKKL